MNIIKVRRKIDTQNLLDILVLCIDDSVVIWFGHHEDLFTSVFAAVQCSYYLV